MEAEAELTALVSIPLLWVDRSAAATRTTSRAISPTRPAVATREEMFHRPMSAGQSADDGGQGLGYLLGHGGEHLILAPERVDDIGMGRLARGVEPATGRGLCGDLTDPTPRIRGGSRSAEPVDPSDEIGKVTEGEHPTQGLGVHRRHLATVRTGSGEHQIGLGDEGNGEVSGTEPHGVAAVGHELGSCPLVHRPSGESTRAGAVHEDSRVGSWPALVQLALQESLDER